jgi:hypothetical protein
MCTIELECSFSAHIKDTKIQSHMKYDIHRFNTHQLQSRQILILSLKHSKHVFSIGS